MKSDIFPNLDLGRQTNQMLFRSVGIWSGWSSETGVHPGLSSLTLEIDSKTDEDGGGGGGGDVRCLLWEIWHWFRHFFFCNKPHQARETKASLGGRGGGIQWRRSGVSTSNCSNEDDGDRGVFFFVFFLLWLRQVQLFSVKPFVNLLVPAETTKMDVKIDEFLDQGGRLALILGMPSRENGMVRAVLPITKFCSPFAKTGFKILKRVLWRPL